MALLAGVLALALTVAPGIVTPGIVAAAPDAQDQMGVISFDDPVGVSGALDTSSTAHQYTFQCAEQGMGSLVAQSTSGDLRTELIVALADGAWSVAGAEVAGAPGVSAAEAFIMPADGRCVATVSRVGETAGSYTLNLWHGFGSLAVLDPFDGVEGPPALVWEDYTSDTMRVQLGPGRLEVTILSENLFGYHLPEGDPPTGPDFYIQVDAQIEDTPSYFEYGLALRVTVDDAQEIFYAIEVSKDNDYAIYYFKDGEWTPLQPWTVSPVIDTSLPTQRIGVALRGGVFRVYFNDQFVGEAEDPNNLAPAGTIALAAATGANQTDPVTVYFDNLLITQPLGGQSALPFGGLGAASPTPTQSSGLGGLGQLLGGKRTPTPAPTSIPLPTPTSPPPPTSTPTAFIPDTIAVQPADAPEVAVAALRAAGLVPAGGALGLGIPSSYGDTSTAKWNHYKLGQGRTFRNFVLSFNARLVATGPGSGCGMYFREAGGANSDAIVFADGYALLGDWTPQGDLTDSSLIQPFDAVRPGQGAFNHVVVIAQEQTVTMYVNGQLFFTAQFEARTGGVALEMYVEPDSEGNTVETYCQLNNIWLWQF